MWRVKYSSGSIKTVSRKNGEVVLEKEIRTAGEVAKIELIADRTEIKADGLDLSFITVKITDVDGNLVPSADNLVNFNVNGVGFIAGVDNGYQASHEPFKANNRKAFNGMCMLIVQSSKEVGDITIKASSENLKTSAIKIRTTN